MMESPTTRIGLAFGSSSLPCQAAAQSITPRPGRSSLITAIQSQTPDPSTPELCWEDTPTASSVPATPEDDSDSDSGAPVPLSPSVTREHRTKLRAIAPLGRPPSSKLGARHTLNYNASGIPFPALIRKDVGTEGQKTISLNTVQNEHKLEDSHDSPPCNAQSRMTQMSETSSHRSASPVNGHDIVIKLEEKDPVQPPELGSDSDEVPSTSGLCDPSIAPDMPKASDNIECESDSGGIGTLVSLTTKNGLGTSDIKVPAVPGAADGYLKLSVSWSPSAALIQLLPNDVIQRLRDIPIHCVATTLKGSRCKNKNAAKLTRAHVDKLLTDLSSLPSLLELSSIMKIMQDLASRATCLHQHQKRAKKELLELSSYTTSENTEEVSKTTTNGSGTEATNNYSAFHLWAQSFLKAHMPVQPMPKPEVDASDEVPGLASTVKVDTLPSDDKLMTHVPEKPKEEPRRPGKNARLANAPAPVSCNFERTIRPSWKPKTRVSPTTFSPGSQSSHLYYDFQPYNGAAKDKNKSPSELIRQLLHLPLSETDSKAEGYIYVYWNPPNFGYVKIGRSNDPKKRLQQWQSKCKIQVQQVTGSSQFDQFEVRHPHRVERLIQAELKEHRLKVPRCNGCEKSHVEWFKVDKDVATKVVEKWSEVSLYDGLCLRQSLTKAEIDKLCEVTTKQVMATTKQDFATPKGKRRYKRRPTQQTRLWRKSSPGTRLFPDPFATSQDDTKEVFKWSFSS